MASTTSAVRVGLWAVLAVAAVGCAEESAAPESTSADVEERRGQRVEVVDPFDAGLCRGEGVSNATLAERFEGRNFTLSTQIAYRHQVCDASGCEAWSAPQTLGVVDTRAEIRGEEDARLVVDSFFRARTASTLEDGSTLEGTYDTSAVIGLDDDGEGLHQVTWHVSDSVVWDDPSVARQEMLAEGAETAIDGTCMRTLAAYPASALDPARPDVTVKFEYAFYTSLEVQPVARLVITEVDPAQPGADRREFVEIRNEGDAPADLRGIDLELVDGRDDEAYFVVALDRAAAVLEPGERLVVGAAALEGATGDARYLKLRSPLQDGPDAVRLVDSREGGGVLDEIRYGTAAERLSDGTTRAALIDGGNGSVCRRDGGLAICATPTPGQ